MNAAPSSTVASLASRGSRTMTSNNTDNIFMCLLCSEGFRNVTALENHVRKHPRETQTPPSKRQRIGSARSGPRASQACHACAAAKTKCDNGVRCKRCIRRDIPCIRHHPISECDALPNTADAAVTTNNSSSTPPVATAANNFSDAPQPQPEPQAHPSTPLEMARSVGSTEVDAAAQVYQDHVLLETPSFYGLPSIDPTQGGIDPERSTVDLDFYNIFDFDGNHDLVLSARDQEFLSSLPLPFREAPREASLGAGTSPAKTVISSMDQSSSQEVYEAFKQSIGRWDPAKTNSRAVEQPSLYMDRITTSKMDCLGSYDPNIISQSLTPRIREQILKLLIKSCDQDNVIDMISSFPAVEVLDRLLKSYLTRQVTTTDIWIHVPTFKVDEVRLELLVACVAAAACLSSSRPVQKFGLAMQEFLVYHLWLVSENSGVLTRDLQSLQALSLQLEMGLWSGVRRKMEISESFSGIVTNALRAGGHFRCANYSPITVTVEDEGEILETKWKQWIQQESFKRLVYHMNLYCTRLSLVTSATSTMSYAELSVPVPFAHELWVAKSATEWKQLYLQLARGSPPEPISFTNLLPDPMTLGSLGPLYDGYYTKFCLLHAVSSMIGRHKQDRSIFAPIDKSATRVSSFADDVQHQRIVHILKHIKLCYEDLELRHTIELDLLFHLCSMHLYAPFEQMELAAGKEGPIEAQRADPALQRWISTGDSRHAAWHAGQILRLSRMWTFDQLKHYAVVAAYHAGLCLWVYGVLSEQGKSGYLQNPTTSAEHSGYVMLDQEESIQTQRWISHARGDPAISGRAGSRDGDQDTSIVSIHSSQLLLSTLLQEVMSRFAWRNSLFVENIHQLLQALQKISHRADKS
ncbi:hypothetical protein HRR83_003533 [Exophiala dermatitidis]|uniref:C2H2-type domain-containing protein n=2 Tax=Exophiala dermatitidis TaxID=5970 RepID=H6BSB9_EXODN|nr:uncharacterized protein HMPREF1120_01519 [Exophiala dermatitidis NIH/UT8656]KAJ4522505.1 hypothetical protein HRR74_003090 [Exophiala dermatitidis]EHY53325.1 hypothetical protein HMPREF1120_01519 [Exophiala dermatitidis NIH/UT8656]KAJ4529830.1 hypothetical protein HRR73_000858 [Exophiala dermatitidis]KAJ4543003.1 hypothetical protein HRR77_005265 [Exophiala dermatitidis]KAJ4543504.1 hypothetical protein HRR76_001573 [Exophiala dermatitidis]